MSSWYVFDPQPMPEFGPGPKLWGPFGTKEKAEQYANVIHEEDGSGNTVVLPVTAP